MLSVFTMVFQTDKSKSILKDHVALDKPTAAQDIWPELQDYFKDSIDQYCNYCSTTCINNRKWKGDTHSCILHFQQQVRNHNKLAPKHFTEDERMEYLQQAVQPLPDLRAIKGTAKTLFKALKKPLSYEDYFDLPSSAAQIYNLEHHKQDPCNLCCSTRHVYAHNFDTFDMHNNNSFFDAIDCSNANDNLFDFLEDIDVNLHNIITLVYELKATWQLDQSTQLPKAIYQQLKAAGKRAWIALPTALKCHIVKHLSESSSSAVLQTNQSILPRSFGSQ